MDKQAATDAALRVKRSIAGDAPIPVGPPPGVLVDEEIEGFEVADGHARIVIVMKRAEDGTPLGYAHEYANMTPGPDAVLMMVEGLARTGFDAAAIAVRGAS